MIINNMVIKVIKQSNVCNFHKLFGDGGYFLISRKNRILFHRVKAEINNFTSGAAYFAVLGAQE